MINVGNNTISKVYLGNLEIKKVYKGNLIIYPYDAEIEYLESTGTQWIDTNLSPNGNNSVEINANIIRINSLRGIICGNFQDNTDQMIFSFEIGGTANSHAGNVRSYRKIGNNSANDIWDSSVIPLNTKCDVTYKYISSSSKLYIINNTYGTSINTASSVGSSTTAHSLRLFLDYRNPNTAIANPIRICSMAIKINDSLVMDLIPVRKGSIGYMYDKVSGKLFGNSGTGEFTLGQDIVKIEYLESTGELVIPMPDIIPTDYDNTIETKMTFLGYSDPTAYGAWFSAYTDENSNTYRIVRTNQSNTQVLVYNGRKAGGGGTTFNASVGTTYNIKLYPDSGTINDTNITYTTSKGNQNSTRISIFGNVTKLRVYNFKLTKGNTVILDLIPVRIGQIGYMYDKVSNRLFSNSGSEDFILGPDI